MKRHFNGIIVVEGKNDAIKLHSLYDCQIVITDGLACPQGTIDMLVEAAKTNEIVVFTDPDSPGNRIRQKIIQAIPSAKQAFIAKKDALGKHKVGVEHAKDEIIYEALANLTEGEKNQITLTYPEYVSLGLAGDKNSSDLRQKVANYLHIGYGNAKTFYHWLNLVGADKKKIEGIINNGK